MLQPRQICVNTACFPDTPLPDALTHAQEMGFRCIELLAFDGARHSQGALAGFWFDRMTDREKQDLAEATASFQHIAVHLPFFELPLFAYDAEMRSFCEGRIGTGLDGAAYLGAGVAVIHAYARPGMACRDYWPLMLDAFRRLSDRAAEGNVRLAVETGFPNTIQDFADLVFDVDRANFGATLDVGHIRSYRDHGVTPEAYGTPESAARYNDCLTAILTRLGERIFHIHLHDVRATDWRDHRAPGRGLIDWPRLFTALAALPYPHLLSFELEEPQPLQALQESKVFVESLIRDREG